MKNLRYAIAYKLKFIVKIKYYIYINFACYTTYIIICKILDAITITRYILKLYSI